ncbi:uncharacterized protein [Nicotiana sylvestris]|uniref:uncharacterized protein n=1 Tax=Nicotiana sylvestris TaxID=4096 RepID=UPI00388C8412
MYQQPNNPPPYPSQDPSSSNNEMGRIETMFEQMMKKNADSNAQLASHNTSIRNLEVQLGQISQALNTLCKGALPSDTVVNPKGGNNTGHAMTVTTRSGKAGVVSTSNLRKIVNDDVVMRDDDEPSNEVQVNEEVRIDIDEDVEETHDDVNLSRGHVRDIPDPVVPKAKAPLPRTPPPYPQMLAKQNNENQFNKFIDMMKCLSINVSLVEALEQMSGYAEFMKDLVTKKRSMNCETIKMTHQVSAIVHPMAPKLEDPSAFTIPCTICSADFSKALCHLGESINLMPYSMFKTLGIGKPRPISMRLKMADWTMKRPLGIIDDVLVRFDKFILPADFVILDSEVGCEVPIILGRPFLATGKALVDVEAGELIFRVGDENVVFHVCKSMRRPNSNEVCSFVDLVTEVIIDDTSVMINVEDPFEAVLLNHDEDEKEGLVDSTLAVLQRRKKAIGWTLEVIRGISPAFCVHNMILEEGAKPSVEHQRRLNEAMQEVVKKAIIKWLDVGVVYPISDSSWTSPMLDRLVGRACNCFLDGYSRYNQILIAPEDQENNTFTCPYGTFSFSRMPFGLCNASATFQRCMMAIITDMMEDFHEVFMDDFSVVGGSFETCLDNLEKVLARCEETNLLLNWEKCYFMVEEGIILGHKISKNGIEVISKLPPPTSVKGVRSFLGHAGFYRRFIKDFSKVVNPICKFLEKDAKFVFNDDCMKAF